MPKLAALSPLQSASFNMGRVLIEIDTWKLLHGTPLEIERGVLIDFIVQHPRAVVHIFPDLMMTMKSHGLETTDFSDLFARRHFRTARELYLTTIADLLSRNLIDQNLEQGDVILVSLTDAGNLANAQLSSALSLSIRAISSVVCAYLKRRNIDDLWSEIRSTLPDESEALALLGQPFGDWLEEGPYE